MPLDPGTRLGAYEVLGSTVLMGEVYRGSDVKLGRDVAIKVLPDHFAGDAERVARFEREAKTLASLNHPHRLLLVDDERAGGTTDELRIVVNWFDELKRKMAGGA